MPHDRPQWEFIYVEDFNEKESLCFFKFHHSFSDGAGIINSMSFMNSTDHISHKTFSGRGIPFYQKFLSGLLYPICLFLYTFVHYRPKWKGYEKIKTKTGENSGDIICLNIKTYKLDDMKKWYKRFKGATMNNFMMGLISKSINKWYQMNGVERTDEITAIVPVAMKPLAPKIDDVDMENNSSGVYFKLKIREDLEEAIKLAKSNFSYYFKLPFLIHNIIMWRAYALLPNAISKYLYHYSCSYLDLTFSSGLAGNEPMYMWDKEIKSLHIYLAPYWKWNLGLVYLTYRENVFLQITADKQLQMDSNQLKTIFENTLDEEIKKE